jgi:hypothetical protein
MLSKPSAESKQAALQVLANLCSDAVDPHSSKTKQLLLDVGAAPHLMRCLSSQDNVVLSYCCGLLQNLCVELAWAVQVADAGTYHRLEQLRASADPLVARYSAGAIANASTTLTHKAGLSLAQYSAKPPTQHERVEAFRRKHAVAVIRRAAAAMTVEARMRRVLGKTAHAARTPAVPSLPRRNPNFNGARPAMTPLPGVHAAPLAAPRSSGAVSSIPSAPPAISDRNNTPGRTGRSWQGRANSGASALPEGVEGHADAGMAAALAEADATQLLGMMLAARNSNDEETLRRLQARPRQIQTTERAAAEEAATRPAAEARTAVLREEARAAAAAEQARVALKKAAAAAAGEEAERGRAQAAERRRRAEEAEADAVRKAERAAAELRRQVAEGVRRAQEQDEQRRSAEAAEAEARMAA